MRDLGVSHGRKRVPVREMLRSGRTVMVFDPPVVGAAGETLEIEWEWE